MLLLVTGHEAIGLLVKADWVHGCSCSDDVASVCCLISSGIFTEGGWISWRLGHGISDMSYISASELILSATTMQPKLRGSVCGDRLASLGKWGISSVAECSCVDEVNLHQSSHHKCGEIGSSDQALG